MEFTSSTLRATSSMSTTTTSTEGSSHFAPCRHCNDYNYCNESFQEGCDALQEESQFRHWSNMEVPKVLFQMCSPFIVTHHISLLLVPVLYTCVIAGSPSSWTTCWGRTCGTTTSTGPPTTRSAHPAISTSPLLVSQLLKSHLVSVSE